MKDVAEVSLKLHPYFDCPVSEIEAPGEESGDSVNSSQLEETGLNPTPEWIGNLSSESEALASNLPTARPDWVSAVRIHLSGGWTFWMPMDEKHRGVDLSFPAEQRIQYFSARELDKGDLLFFRTGESETEELDRLTVEELGADFMEVRERQNEWKAKLRSHLQRMGPRLVARELRSCGVKCPERVERWAEDLSLIHI